MGDANRVFKTALFICRERIFLSLAFLLCENILLYFRYIIVSHHNSEQKPHNSSFLNSQLDLRFSPTQVNFGVALAVVTDLALPLLL